MDNVFGSIIDLNECLKDSPNFRYVLEQNELDVDQLEVKLDKLVKLCTAMVEAGKQFIRTKSNFINGIWDLLIYFKDDPVLVNSLNRFVQSLTELLKYDNILIDQANRAVNKNLSHFIKDNIHKTKETKKHFDRISDELDSVLTRHSQSPKSKPHEFEETQNILTATRSCFQHTALDYTSQLSVLKSCRRHEILDSLLSLMHAYGTHFHQGSDLFQDFEPFKKETAVNILKMREQTNTLEKKLESRHNLVKQKDTVPTLIKSNHIKLEGYLFKRTTNAFKTWNRRWFIIQDHQLVYQKRTQEREVTVMEEDLRLCTARPVVDIDRRFCFEVISPSKSHMLQADSEETCQQWLTAMQLGTDAAYNDSSNEVEDSQESCGASSIATSSSSSSINMSSNVSSNVNPPTKPLRAVFSQILSLPGNEKCCDCGSLDPRWASVNLGITLCIECSGIHRSFGVHMSKVRSLTLDAWDPELVKVMHELGNDVVNKIYEANVDGVKRATFDSPRNEREAWIKAKYVNKLFVNKNKIVFGSEDSLKILQSEEKSLKESTGKENEESTNVQLNLDKVSTEKTEEDAKILDVKLEPHDRVNQCDSSCDNFYNKLLYKAAFDCDLPAMCEALAKGAFINWINEDDKKQTPLHQAIFSGSVVSCEYLLLNGAKCQLADESGQTCLHLATELGNTGQVCLLLKRGADSNCLDSSGRDALTIAVDNANADIVTLLRLAKLNEEMKNDEFGNPNDETFNEVVRDFSQLASHSPEKLRRNNHTQESEETL